MALTYFFELFTKFVYDSFKDFNIQKPFYSKPTSCLNRLTVPRDVKTNEVTVFELGIVYAKILLNEHGKMDTVTHRAKKVDDLLKGSYKMLELT